MLFLGFILSLPAFRFALPLPPRLLHPLAPSLLPVFRTEYCGCVSFVYSHTPTHALYSFARLIDHCVLRSFMYSASFSCYASAKHTAVDARTPISPFVFFFISRNLSMYFSSSAWLATVGPLALGLRLRALVAAWDVDGCCCCCGGGGGRAPPPISCCGCICICICIGVWWIILIGGRVLCCACCCGICTPCPHTAPSPLSLITVANQRSHVQETGCKEGDAA